MANLSKIKRDNMIAFLEQLKQQHADDESIRAFNEIENHLREKKYGLVWEEHSEEVDELLNANIPVLTADTERRLCKDRNLPWNFIIEGDNLQALYLLEKTHNGKVDCIYIDPPYNTGAKDWKYNNDYVDGNDVYRHSKWLSMMKNRLRLAKNLLNPEDSVLIVTIDEKEYLHLGCLLEEMFPTARIQMISDLINRATVAFDSKFGRSNEYIFIVFIGNAAPAKLALEEDWNHVENTTKDGVHWVNLCRTGTNSHREDRPGMFYPIFVSKDGKKIVGLGDVLPLGENRMSVMPPEDCIAVWPIHTDGTEGRWMQGKDSLQKLIDKGYVKLGKFTKTGMAISYLNRAQIEKIEAGYYVVTGYNENGSVIIDDSNYSAVYVPDTQWNIKSHDAARHGTNLLQTILASKRFTFPKSLYSVHDVLRFFVIDKPNAVIVDFFAGSGTTLHAVNLLNAKYGGQRTCILVTNNEVSVDEEKDFVKRGIEKGSKEWESHGIAKFVTWPRTVCSINGVDVNGKPLKGNYLDSDIAMAEGFNANVKYFKCDWTPRKPEDYLLSNALCLHIREMIELQNSIEIDNVKNVLILNKSDFKNIIMNTDIYNQIQNIWINQNIILNAEELRLLETKGYKYIPREFFGQELREAAE